MLLTSNVPVTRATARRFQLASGTPSGLPPSRPQPVLHLLGIAGDK